jgi:hypothetical protein
VTPPTKEKEGWRHKFTLKYFRNNLRKIMFLIIYILISLGIGAYTVMEVLEKGTGSAGYFVIRLGM